MAVVYVLYLCLSLGCPVADGGSRQFATWAWCEAARRPGTADFCARDPYGIIERR